MTGPRGLFHEPLGVDFSEAFATGLRARLVDGRPETLARTTILVNTNRMARRIEANLAAAGATLLPRIGLVSDIAALVPMGRLPPLAHAPLRDRLALARIIRALLIQQTGLAPPGAAFDMAGSLSALLTEMREEGVGAETLAKLDFSDAAKHWETSAQFLRIAATFAAETGQAGLAAHQDAALALLRAHWVEAPPQDPIIIAGSTASRGQTRQLAQLVLALPQGCVVLPGMDMSMPEQAWAELTQSNKPLAQPQDHPQFRHAALLKAHGLDRAACPQWSETPVANAARTALLSLALRPAPATNAWRQEGPALPDLADACGDITLVHAPSTATEATAIALGLRAALDQGRRAALIAPDRALTRQVASQLSRWGIVPDDSAGMPLVHSVPGRLALQSAGMLGHPVEAQALTILLNHPMVHGQANRQRHLRFARALELTLLRDTPCPFPTRTWVEAWAEDSPADEAWIAWLTVLLDKLATTPRQAPLPILTAAHLDLLDHLVLGSTSPPTEGEARPQTTGEAEVRLTLQDLAAAADIMGDTALGVHEYRTMLHALLSAEDLRESHSPHPDVMIWGALEARARTADLVILGGLNDGVWPATPSADPWLNRAMRAELGLRLPDRAVGLSAHDFQQAASGAEIWLTRATRGAEAETVPSRWLNRLEGLLGGLGPAGTTALDGMRARGDRWLNLAQSVSTPTEGAATQPAPRPGPMPPRAALPKKLSVTEIETLIRDPYAIYAKKILSLVPLNPLHEGPSGRLRGSALHSAMEAFTKATQDGIGPDAPALLRAAMDQALQATAPWPAMRRLWLGRLDRITEDLLAAEETRRSQGPPLLAEEAAALSLPEIDLTLIARADRLDAHDGGIAIYDYKTSIPSAKEQAFFAKQLVVEAVMVTAGAFPSLGPQRVDRVAYLQIGSTYKESTVTVDDALLATTRAELCALWQAYRDGRPFIPRLAPDMMRYAGAYDHLARFGEWDDTIRAKPLVVGGP